MSVPEMVALPVELLHTAYSDISAQLEYERRKIVEHLQHNFYTI